MPDLPNRISRLCTGMRTLCVALALGTPLPIAAQRLLADVIPGPPDSRSGSSINFLSNVGGLAFFSPDGVTMWRTDGTGTGTFQLPRLDSLGIRTQALPVNGLACWCDYAHSPTTDLGWRLVVSDGTLLGTRVIWQGGLSLPSQFVSTGNAVYLRVPELWESDGTTAGTRQWPMPQPPAHLHAVGGRVFYSLPGTNPPGSYDVYVGSGGGIPGVRLVNQTGGWLTNGIGGVTALGSDLICVGTHSSAGSGLFKISGTPLAISLVQGGVVVRSKLVAAGGKLFFRGVSPTTGNEPWITDGTPAGTSLLRDIVPGAGDSNPETFTAANGRMVFVAWDPTNGAEPWVSDGTTAGTGLLRDVRAGITGSNPTNLYSLGKDLFFVADDGTVGRELWFSDGTTAGTSLVRDIRPGKSGSHPGSAPIFYTLRGQEMTHLGGRLLFAADDGTTGHELWTSDGTAVGTRLLADRFGRRLSSSPGEFTRSGDQIWFVSHVNWDQRNLSTTDGNTFGGSARGPNGKLLVMAGGGVDRLVGLGDGRVAVLAGEGQAANGIWIVDPGRRVGVEVTPGSSFMLRMGGINGRVVFPENGSVWSSDGTSTGMVPLFAASRDVQFFRYRDQLLLWCWQSAAKQAELWVTDGVAAGTRRLAVLPEAQAFLWRPVLLTHDGVCFPVYAQSGAQVWKSDGRSMWRAAELDQTGADAWTMGGVHVAVLGQQTFLSRRGNAARPQSELWVSDGTMAGTVQLLASPGMITGVVATASQVFFWADASVHGGELWVTRGTIASTRMVKDIHPTRGQWFTPMLAVGDSDLVLFGADDVIAGREPWVSDGTAAGTRLVADLYPGSESSLTAIAIGDFASCGASLMFAADHPQLGVEPWVMPIAQFQAPLAETIEYGCPGSGNLVPAIGVRDRPVLGSPNFAITLSQGRSASAWVLALDLRRTPVRVGRCTLQVDPLQALLFGNTDGQGAARIAVQVPNDPGLLGRQVVGQFGVADPAGAWFNALALSPGLRLVFGQ